MSMRFTKNFGKWLQNFRRTYANLKIHLRSSQAST